MRFDNWEIVGFDRDKAVEFYDNGINPLVSVLLASRGVTDIHEAQAAVGGEPALFYDPFLMVDMDKAVSRIKKAVETGEHIAVYGDYDVDGMTSVAVLAMYLKSKNANFEIYIPERFDEGYGLNNTALDTLKSHGVSLVITVDCGVTAIEEAKYAKSIGLDLVITDHHECRDVLPEACAIVDAKRHDCNYPYKSLAGVGVVFKLVCALEGDYLSDSIFDKYIDLVAIGTVADVMPVVDENRELIRRGLIMLNSCPRPGLHSLLVKAETEIGKVTASTISYVIAPRLNAAGRMAKTTLSIEILLTESSEEAEDLAGKLCHLNSERRCLEHEIYEEAKAMLNTDKPEEPIVLARHGWYKGVTGIVASKMADLYKLPVIVISIDYDENGHGIGRGSCRSSGEFPLYDALCSCEDILDNYGGHIMAAGVTVAEENIDELRRRLTEYYHKNNEIIPWNELKLDFEVEKPELLTLSNIEALKDLEPFGNGNPLPCLCMLGVEVLSAQSVGSGKHSKLKIEKSGTCFECIFFSACLDDLGIKEGDLVDIAFEPQANEFRGRSSVQLQLFDIKPVISQL
ncbi:MAG: single-stranded-DNA-specific exonuclease RecJ [Oscillospiraceae bacterium]|jgi:single-stranded-DNA-specific exonuclease|nr:single-stranded-DNA-specific exonuclease RecJ [Oscillospiraceae bacterium]